MGEEGGEDWGGVGWEGGELLAGEEGVGGLLDGGLVLEVPGERGLGWLVGGLGGGVCCSCGGWRGEFFVDLV